MNKWSLKTCIVLSSFDKEDSLYCDHKKGSVLAWKQELTECHNILIVQKVKDFYASVNSSSAQTPPPPPRANPRALAFFFQKNGQIPRGGGHISCLNSPGWGRRKRASAPPPGSLPSNWRLYSQATLSVKNQDILKCLWSEIFKCDFRKLLVRNAHFQSFRSLQWKLAILWAFKFGPFCLKSVRETGSSFDPKFRLVT